jgi:hypothetical protein
VAAVAITVWAWRSTSSPRRWTKKQRVIEGQAAAKLQKYVLGQYTRISDMLNYTSTRTGVAARLAAIAQQPGTGPTVTRHSGVLSFAEWSVQRRGHQDCILIAQNGAVYSQTATQYGDAVASYDFLNDPLFRAFLASDSGFSLCDDNPVRYKIASRGEVITILWSIYNPARLPRRSGWGFWIVNVRLTATKPPTAIFPADAGPTWNFTTPAGRRSIPPGTNAPDTPWTSPSSNPVGATGLTVSEPAALQLIREQTNAADPAIGLFRAVGGGPVLCGHLPGGLLLQPAIPAADRPHARSAEGPPRPADRGSEAR